MSDPSPKLVLLAEGRFEPNDAKSAVGVLRYRPERVCAVLDSTRAGARAGDLVGVGGDVPVVASLDHAAPLGAGALLIGIAPQGGGLPEAWRAVIRDALGRGWDVWSGLHEFLADDPEFAALASARGAALHDVRRAPADRPIAAARAARVDAQVVLTIGTDCNVGKMTAALEIERALAAHGARARFVATGQTGIFIAGGGVAVDAVPSDFVAGHAERLVLEAAREADVVLVEGQGSLFHPAYSGVTLGLLHGAAPSALVLCHDAARTHLRYGANDAEAIAIPPLARVREACERAAAWVRPAPVVAAALNTRALAEREARAACERAAAELGVPATDPVRFGAGPIADALLARSRRTHAPHV